MVPIFLITITALSPICCNNEGLEAAKANESWGAVAQSTGSDCYIRVFPAYTGSFLEGLSLPLPFQSWEGGSSSSNPHLLLPLRFIIATMP